MSSPNGVTANDIEVDISWFDMLPAGIEVSDPWIAAALCCRSQLWPLGEHRALGGMPGQEYGKATLLSVDARFNPRERKIAVIFILGGDPLALRIRRLRFSGGEIYIPDKKEWRSEFSKCCEIVRENRERAAIRLNNLISGGALA